MSVTWPLQQRHRKSLVIRVTLMLCLYWGVGSRYLLVCYDCRTDTVGQLSEMYQYYSFSPSATHLVHLRIFTFQWVLINMLSLFLFMYAVSFCQVCIRYILLIALLAGYNC